MAPTPTPERERENGREAGLVMALSLRLTGDRPAAEELMQDAFVREWERLPSFRGESAFATWMHRVTVNTFLQDTRSDKRRGAHEEQNEDIDALPTLWKCGRSRGAGRSSRNRSYLLRAASMIVVICVK